MCGRYYVDDSIYQTVAGMLQRADDEDRKKWPASDICPSDTAPLLTGAGDGLELSFQRWGYAGIGSGQMTINARAESALEKRMFRNGIRGHRAVIPCTRFYEWNRNKEKIEFSRQDSPAVFMAGFFDIFPDGCRYIILTTAANESMIRTHDRMPLVLESSEVREWILDGGKTEELLHKVPVLLQKHAEYEQETLF